MIEISIPGFGDVNIEHIVMDYNGTMACDGIVFNNVKKLVEILSKEVKIHVITADTFGRAGEELKAFPLTLSILPEENQDQAKLLYVEKLGFQSCVCIGNGRNDALMLKNAKIGIVLLQEEGASVKSVSSADILCRDIESALKLFIKQGRVIATLRS
ncbi:MAG: ATPase P [Thermodesulfobacteriota bacterium]|nr:ATPase P [Thermodesulfobacteriota bacterium]